MLTRKFEQEILLLPWRDLINVGSNYSQIKIGGVSHERVGVLTFRPVTAQSPACSFPPLIDPRLLFIDSRTIPAIPLSHLHFLTRITEYLLPCALRKYVV